MARRLRLLFSEADVFREEYERNIVKGGAFIRTAEEFQLRDPVEVELELDFCAESVVLEAEIVHCVSAEQTGSAATAGVAIQFLESAPVIRDRLQRFVEANPDEGAESAEPLGRALFGDEDISGLDLEEATEATRGSEEAAFFDPSEVDLSSIDGQEASRAPVEDRRRAARARARVPARIDAGSSALDGHTRDISEAGALISGDGGGLPVGKGVKLEFVHPVSGERLEVAGTVSRHVETEGTIAAVAIEFGPQGADDGVAEFVKGVHEVASERIRTGISGAIEELGMVALVRMFGMTAKQGTLTVIAGAEEGSIDFENRMMRHARLGELRGVKALARIFSWERGRFEFHAHLDPADGEAAPIALEDAVQQALGQREEVDRADLAGSLDPGARFSVDTEALRAEGGVTKTQEAVLDLVTTGFTVRRILDVIPESDADVLGALKYLLDREIIRKRGRRKRGRS